MSSPTPTQLTCHGMTDAGRVRSVNEDHFGLFPEGGVFVVADGVGGSENGALASRMVVEACQRAALAPGARALPPDARATLITWSRGGTAALTDLPTVRAHQRLLREFVEEHLADGRALRAWVSWEQGDP